MSEGRLFRIVYLLLERGNMTAAELAQKLEVSVRTIYRDVDALCAAGVPIQALQGQGGGYSILPGFSLSRALLSADEQAALLTALQSQPDERSAALAGKLSGFFRREEPDWLQVDLTHWGADGSVRESFNLLRDAILQHRIIEFTYVSSYAETTRRRVLPARLCLKGQSWYLQGFCLDRRDYRTFKLSRMVERCITDEQFTTELSPPALDIALPPPHMLEFTLRFLPALAFRVYDEFDRSCITPQSDGSLVVKTSMPEDAWIYGYLLSFGTGLEVLAPEHVKMARGRLAVGIAENTFRNTDAHCQDSRVTIRTSQTKEGVSMEQKFCQSCGMPLTDASLHGREHDGGINSDYCKYCYEDGKFSGEMTMEQMIDFCAPMTAQACPGTTEEQARAQMRQFFPLLKRWKA